MVPMQLHRTSEPVFIQRGNRCSSLGPFRQRGSAECSPASENTK